MHMCRVTAPAKINLSLGITGLRYDGYHLLSMVLQSVALSDTVTLTRTNSREITLTVHGRHPLPPCGKDNLAARAAALFFERCGMTAQGLKIDLHKEIPLQAGLAGGSADAAAVLTGLNTLFETKLDRRALCSMGLELGADVPFCLIGGAALAEGVGELLQPLPSLVPCHIVIAKPSQGIDTGEAYACYDRSPAILLPDNDLLAAAVAAGSLAKTALHMRNVLETVCPLPEVGDIKRTMLSLGALGAQMTGSGSAVFGLFEKKPDAKRCAAHLEERYDEVFVTAPCPHGARTL